jgi:hypothetical protein
MTWEPQSGVQLAVAALGDIDANERPPNVGLLAIPRGANFRVEVLRIGYMAEVAVVGTGATVDIEFLDSLLTGTALTTAVQAFSLTNASEDRVFDADTAANQELANVLGTLVSDLETYGLNFPAYTITNLTTDRDADISGPPADAVIADILGTFINDILAGSLPYYDLTNITTDRDADMSGPPSDQVLADILATLITDLRPRSDLTLDSTTSNLENASIQDYNSLFVGSQILESGDSLNAELTLNTVSTVGEGYSFITEYRVLQHS